MNGGGGACCFWVQRHSRVGIYDVINGGVVMVVMEEYRESQSLYHQEQQAGVQ